VHTDRMCDSPYRIATSGKDSGILQSSVGFRQIDMCRIIHRHLTSNTNQ
jgi:hypothetical protein